MAIDDTFDDDRPSPEDFLEHTRSEGKGKLKVFLGAAPGVGKTYAMLKAAHELRTRGVDVVVGVIETHGRQETEKVLAGLDVIPRKAITYRGLEFSEMDLDAILARKPQLVLVDEFAHTNIEGSRHPKRYQDVIEIVEAGIDVYTTLNIQHLESLNDIVTKITRTRIRETIPDKVLDVADEIALVDLPPKELQARLREGNVYVPEQAKRAIKHFFGEGNLTALRELALRYTAERVDNQMLSYMKTHGIQGLWPARDRLLVCIGDTPAALELVRVGKRTAERRGASWIVLHVETPTMRRRRDPNRDYVTQAMTLAEDLGAETAIVASDDSVAEIVRFAHSRKITRITVGKSKVHWWWKFMPSVADRLLNKTTAFEILVVPSEEAQLTQPRPNQEDDSEREIFNWREYLTATAAAGAAGAVAFAVDSILSLPNLLLIFLAAILFVAVRTSLWPAIYTTFLSYLIYHVIVTEPDVLFHLTRREDVLTIGLFLTVAGITSSLANQVAMQVEAFKQNAKRTAKLYDFSRKVAGARDLDSVLWAVVHHVAVTVNGKSLLLQSEGGRLEIVAGYPPEDELDTASAGAAEWAFKHGEIAGHKSATLPAAPWLFVPMKTDSGMIGVLGVQFSDASHALTHDQKQLLDAVAHQAAVAIERTQLARTHEQSKVLAETEKFRTALLSSISHDFRAPLAAILQNVGALRSSIGGFEDRTHQRLLEGVEEDAERLNRFIKNLLDMTKLGAGTLKPKISKVSVLGILDEAVDRIKQAISQHHLVVIVPEEFPQLAVDPILIEQVLVNILDNACKYSELGSTIRVEAAMDGAVAVIDVIDEGCGIPEKERAEIFEMFKPNRSAAAGQSGFGLAICKGIVESHGGTIEVLPHGAKNSTCIRLRLPQTL